MDKEERNETGLNISDLEHFLDLNKKAIMDHIMNKIFKDAPQKIKPSGEIFDRIVNQLMQDVPFGTMIQFALANAVMYSLWCGYQSQILKNDSLWCGYQSQILKNDPSVHFKDEYIEQVQDAINRAFNIGWNYASRAT
jgi:hypothetical protein